ncbi:GNAT family N-acetyltransferase [Micromonospora cathayae]|uniref:GNAT family N-acetyltransferase n=1 Tax=Micromonospora cathayae TaxID=3028804 RepID=A0ABY8A0F2_9ACTN|nr:GNAT family N-acetyltransferase [Micromonospora sp. HUAS 3]WDZ87474.1 GNAT family N-acetyltransferase [Micromonospora sp. HUAS 3]
MAVITETGRLRVREWTEEPTDLARFYDIYSRVEVVRWFGAAPNLPLTDPDQAAGVIRGWRSASFPDGRYGFWAIEVRDTGLVAGTALVKPLRGRDMSPVAEIEVGWHLHPDCQGNGYATEAARAVLAREFAAGTELIHAVVLPGNEPSIAVTRRLGMTHVGRRTDWYGGVEMETFVLSATDYADPS